MMRPEHYRQLAAWFQARPAAYRLLCGLNRGLPVLFYSLYPLLLIWLAVRQDGRFLRVLLVPAAAYLTCTLIRRVIRANRPYETPGFEPLIARRKTGDSFPSRHMTCASVITMSYGFIFPPAGWLLAIAAIAIAAVRVAAGIHFPRDVFAGGLLGFLFGIAGFWIL